MVICMSLHADTYDVQNVSSHNGNLTIVFLNGSAAQGAFIVLAIAENKLPNSSFEYVYASAEKPPADNTLIVAISRLSRTNIAKSNSSLILSVYDIESTGLLKSSRSLIPVTTLIIQNTSTLTSSDSNYGEFMKYSVLHTKNQSI